MISKFIRKKNLLLLLLIIFLVFTVFIYKFMFGKPFTLNQLYTRTFVNMLKDDPEALTQLGILDGVFDFYSDDLTDVSPEKQQEKYKLLKKDFNYLQSYDIKNLSDKEKLSYDIFKWYLHNEVDGEKFMYHNYPVNQDEGIQSQLPEIMISIQEITNKQSAEDYIERLSKYNIKFDGLIRSLKIRETKNIIPPKFILEKVLEETKNFIDSEPKNNILMTSFIKKLDTIEDLNDKQKKELINKAELQIKENVIPAYKNLVSYLEYVLQISTEDAGVWKLPDGDEYYAYKLKAYTTTQLTANQIHQIGLKEVARITQEMNEIIKSLSYEDITPGEFMKKLSVDSRFKYNNTKEAHAAVIQDYISVVNSNNVNLSDCFDIKPIGNVEVKPIPEFKQDTSPQAYFVPVSSDGSRPGTLYINLGKIDSINKYSIRSFVAHETIPGHHIQRGIQRQLKGVPMFRKAVPFTVFAEGWAMYSERLAWEKESIKDPYENLGRLQSELWRATRLVVDTGLHYKRWTREQAVEYMVNTTGISRDIIEIEVDRYIVDPGQACAYEIGMLKFLELREKAKLELGEKFDIKDFHNAVLKNGAIPLNILEKEVDKYIASKLSK